MSLLTLYLDLLSPQSSHDQSSDLRGETFELAPECFPPEELALTFAELDWYPF